MTYLKYKFSILTTRRRIEVAVLDTINTIDLSVAGTPSIVIRDLSEYATLPFLAAFDVPSPSDPEASPSPSKERKPTRRVTYIALTKKVMPLLLDIFLQFRGTVGIYNDETVESIISVSSVTDNYAMCQ